MASALDSRVAEAHHQHVRRQTRIHSGIGKDTKAGQGNPSLMRTVCIVILEL